MRIVFKVNQLNCLKFARSDIAHCIVKVFKIIEENEINAWKQFLKTLILNPSHLKTINLDVFVLGFSFQNNLKNLPLTLSRLV